ncbi:MAG: nucleotide-binding protein [Candidatus Freyarchaeota archaeon]
MNGFFRRKPIGDGIFTLSVTGGKGGTGKSTIAINLAVSFMLDGYRVLLVDCDVDAPNTALLLDADFLGERDVNRFLPFFDEEKCVRCGECVKSCRSHALIEPEGETPLVFPELCNGCMLCWHVCPADAVREGYRKVGAVKDFSYRDLDIVVGELLPNEREAAPIVNSLRERVEELVRQRSYDVVIVDTAPGIHCGVVRALEMTENALAVTEPTPLGAHDLDIILELTSLLGLSSYVVLNRAGIGDAGLVYNVCERRGVKLLAEIPFDMSLFECYAKSVPVVSGKPSSPSAKAIMRLYEKIREAMK